MSRDINDPTYPFFSTKEADAGEEHREPANEGIKTNVKDYEHPYFTSNGMIQVINSAREFANTKEKPLDGKIPDKVFEDIALAARKTKVAYDILLMVCDWMEDMTSRSGASDAEGIAKKMLSYVPDLRSSLGRDPMNGEVFAALVLESASKVKEILDLSVSKPDEEAKEPGTKKDDIVIMKKRGEKEQKRTNRELYDFFYRRSVNGKQLFKEDLGKDKYG